MSTTSETPKGGTIRPIFLILLVVALIGLGVLAALFLRDRRATREQRETWAAAKRDERAAPAAAIALAPLPVKSPLVERSGADEFGYPLSYVDQAALRSLLGRRKFVELNGYIEGFQRDFEADFRREYWLNDVADALGSAESELGSQLDAWAQATPDAFAPYLARGSHRFAAGMAARGTDVVGATEKTNFEVMRKEFAAANVDLDRALALRPRLIAALRQKLRVAMVAGDRAGFQAVASDAFKRCPECMQPRVVQQFALMPRWGGTYQQMEAAAAAAPVQLNPRFRLLPGYEKLDRASVFVQKELLDKALEHIERACKLGDHVDFLEQKADILTRRKEVPAAVATLKRALELSPSRGETLIALARAEATEKDWRSAHRDLSAGLRVDPTSSDARALLPFVVKGLTFVGWEAHKQGRGREAIELLDLAAELDPNGEVQSRRVAVLTSGFKGSDAELAALEKAALAAPRDFYAHELFDYALASRRDFARVIAMWTAYLKENPDDARAYLERGGALRQQGRVAEAFADVERACELGSSTGCAYAKRR